MSIPPSDFFSGLGAPPDTASSSRLSSPRGLVIFPSEFSDKNSRKDTVTQRGQR